MSRPEICFEDFKPGETTRYGAATLDADEIIAFGKEFDNQPFHTDVEAAKASFTRGLIASGWQTNGVLNRINCDHFLNRSSCMGSPGVDAVQWLLPVRPGDRLSVERTILGTEPSRSRPDRGTVHSLFKLINQNDEVVTRHDCKVMFGRRTPGNPVAVDMVARKDRGAEFDDQSIEDGAHGTPLPLFDDLPVGRTSNLGTYEFTPDRIRRFALAYDNQAFHLDPAAAAASHFGGIVASGWHTAAAWMATMLRDRAEATAAAEARGEAVGRLGVSPGFTDMRFYRPVREGDRLTYRSRITDKRPSATRPEWGLVYMRNTGHNQHGECAFAFTGCVFWERRRP